MLWQISFLISRSRMGSSYVLTCDGICCCDQRKKKVRDHLNTIDGVKIIGEIDEDNGRCQVTINISGSVDPNTVKEEFQKLCRMNDVKLNPIPSPQIPFHGLILRKTTIEEYYWLKK